MWWLGFKDFIWFFEMDEHGPQKLATIIGHKYSIFKPSKKNKGVFLIIKVRQIFCSNFFQNFQFFGVMNFKNCVYISWKIQILTILRHKITQIFTKKYYLLSKFSKLHNLEIHFFSFWGPVLIHFKKSNKILKTWSPHCKNLAFRTHHLWNSTTELIYVYCYIASTLFQISLSFVF